MEWIAAHGPEIFSFLTGSMAGTLLSIYFTARRQRTDLTFKIIEQFFMRHAELGQATGFLLKPETLEDPLTLNRVLSLGDWFETIALMCRESIIDQKLIRKLGIDGQMKGFLVACEGAGAPVQRGVDAWSEMKTFVNAAAPKALVAAEGEQNGG